MNVAINRTSVIRIGGAFAGLAFVVILDAVLQGDDVRRTAKFLLGRGAGWHGVTEQNVMWVVFSYGMAELLLRLLISRENGRELTRRYLPEDQSTVLQIGDLGAIVRKIRVVEGVEKRYLPRLIRRVILQFQSSRSTNQANSLLNSSLELFLQEIELRYSVLKYIAWLIPTLGFIGTVRGIALALSKAGAMKPDNPDLLRITTDALGLAFDTTLLALVLAAILVMCMQLLQGKEEQNLNDTGNYCVDNLINRLYEG